MAKECEFVVVDSTADEGQNGEYLKKARKDNAGSILADSLKDMVDKILAKFDRDKCDCIKKLKIIGHGSEGLIIIGNGRNPDDPKKRINDKQGEWEDELKRLKPQLCKKAEVEILSCFFGAGDKGAKKLSAMADVLGTTVIGYNVYTQPGGYPEQKEGWQKVVAKPGKPAKKVDKVESRLPSLKTSRSEFISLQSHLPAAICITCGSSDAPFEGVPKFLFIKDSDNIRAMLAQVDGTQYVDVRLIGGSIDAELWVCNAASVSGRFEITDDFQHIGNPGQLSRFHPISRCGQVWFRQLAFLHKAVTIESQG